MSEAKNGPDRRLDRTRQSLTTLIPKCVYFVLKADRKEGLVQPRSQGLSSLPPLSFVVENDNGGREERPWERGWN